MKTTKFTFLFCSILLAQSSWLKAQLIMPMAQNKPESIGTAVNTEYSELNPVMAPDGRILYFGRKNHPSNKFGMAGTEQIAGSQDIWFSESLMGAWTTARRMPESLNRDQYNTIFSVSPDGQTILVKGSYVNGQYETRGFSIAKKNGSGWDVPKKLDIPKYEKMSKGKSWYIWHPERTVQDFGR